MGPFSAERILNLFAYYCQGSLSSSVIFLSKKSFRKSEGVYFKNCSLHPLLARDLKISIPFKAPLHKILNFHSYNKDEYVMYFREHVYAVEMSR